MENTAQLTDISCVMRALLIPSVCLVSTPTANVQLQHHFVALRRMYILEKLWAVTADNTATSSVMM